MAQQIEPNLGWFFGAIRPDAGDGSVEREAFDVASYGKQIGLLTEALLGLSGRSSITAEQAKVALDRLEGIRKQIEELKKRKGAATVEQLSEQLEGLRLSQPAAFELLSNRFWPRD
ncbi:hypothetical protein [Polaromonas sp. A23]|uniref:hypothetical protein n=1 Tax=Polaromonas sp. A23 TaxID=1944133 RepID=UPI00157CB343|nr:hypothetical protein [Polaromonas sp. A23]